ncbi:MAG TPA: ATP-binding protein [Burkholderiales bacterium]
MAASNNLEEGRSGLPMAGGADGVRLGRMAAAGAGALAVLVAAFAGFGIWQGYRAAIEDSELDARSLAKVVSTHAEQGIKSIDRNLASVEAVLKSWPNPQGPSEAQVEWLLRGRLQLDPNVRRLQIVDAQGRLAHEASDRMARQNGTLAGREYVTWHRDHAAPALHVSAPVQSAALKTGFIPVSRRLTAADGGFGGVIVASLMPVFLEDFYSSVNTGPHGIIAIFLRDGTMLARGPRREGVVGKSFAGTTLFRGPLAAAPSGTFQQVSTTDGMARIYGYATVPDTDLVVVVGFGKDDVLAGWRSQTISSLTAMAVFLAALVVLTVLLMRRAAQLAAGEARYRRLLDTASEAIFKVDGGGRISLVNRETCAMLGRTEAELLGASPLDFVHEDDRAFAGEMRALREAQSTGRFELRVRGREGAVLNTIVSTRSIFDDAGHYIGALVMLTDITQRARAERTLQGNLARLEALRAIDRSILEAQSLETVAAIGLRGLHTQLPYWGATVLTFDFQAGLATVLAIYQPERSAYKLGPAMTLDDYGREDIAMLATGAECVVPDIGELPSLPPVLAQLRGQGVRSYARIPLLAEGALIGALNLGSDAVAAYTPDDVSTARTFADQLAIALRQAELRAGLQRQAAELERRVAERTAELQNVNRELEAFSYSVSHDLRAPARHIKGFAGMLLEDAPQLDEASRALVRRIAASAERMSALIDALLSLAHTSTQALTRTRVELAPLVKEIAEELTAQAGARAIEWKIAPLGAAEGDPALLRVALANLLGNAVKYTARRERAVIEIGRGEDGAYFVRDNGAGFDMRYASKLFGVFSRLHSASEFEGTGIGLATVRRIIDRHGGRIWAEGTPGAGAVFYFTLRSE